MLDAVTDLIVIPPAEVAAEKSTVPLLPIVTVCPETILNVVFAPNVSAVLTDMLNAPLMVVVPPEIMNEENVVF